MIRHFAVHRFCPVCRPGQVNGPINTTNVMAEVNCPMCWHIVDSIVVEAIGERAKVPVDHVEVYPEGDRWIWKAVGKDGKTITASEYGYDQQAQCTQIAKVIFPDCAVYVQDEVS